MKQTIENDREFCFSDLTGAQDGSVRMFEWGHSQQILCFRSPGNTRVTRIRFNHQGNKVRNELNAWFQNSWRHIYFHQSCLDDLLLPSSDVVDLKRLFQFSL